MVKKNGYMYTVLLEGVQVYASSVESECDVIDSLAQSAGIVSIIEMRKRCSESLFHECGTKICGHVLRRTNPPHSVVLEACTGQVIEAPVRIWHRSDGASGSDFYEVLHRSLGLVR